MKNLFKNLMLVAVAAMAFTACQKDNGELDAPKRIVNFTANIGGDDTRSGFTGKEGDAYKSAWKGGETLFVKAENTETWPTIDAEGKFSVEFSAGDQYASFYSPAASWEYNTSYSVYMPVVPATQTPSANSVDPAAHILQAQSVFISGSENINVTFEHAVAYGKMTVNTPAGFDISKVEINLVGIDYYTEKDLTYTINADHVENNVFWFATETLKVSEMTVTAYGKEGETDKIYSKTVTVAEGKLEFAYGRVGSFSVSNLVEYEEPAAPAFTSASADSASGDTYVYFSSEELGTLKLNTYNCFSDSTWPAGTYTFGTSWGQIYPGNNYGYSKYNDIELYDGSVIVSIVDGKYHIEMFNLADSNGNIVLDYATYTGTIPPLQVPDLRQALATPNANATVDGKTITISWAPVDNAEGYRVKLYSPYDEYKEEIITGTEYVYEAQQWNTNYSFTIMSYASDENETYKPSEDAYVDIKTEKDPNAVLTADYTATDIVWNDTEQRFEFIGADLQYFYIKMNANDRPGNNSFAIGDYTGAGTRYPVEKQFSVMQKQNSGYSVGWTDTSTVSTMSIDVKNGEYVIYIDYTALYDQGHYTIMYKGRPTGFDIPGEDNNNPDEGGNDEEVIDLTGFTKMNLSGFEAGAANFVAVITFKDPVYGDEYKFSLADTNGINVSNKTLAVGEYTFVESFNSCEMEASDYYYLGEKQNPTGKVNVYNDNGVYTIKCEVKIGFSTLKHYYQGTL